MMYHTPLCEVLVLAATQALLSGSRTGGSTDDLEEYEDL